MIHVVMPVGLLQCNCSIFGDEQSKQAIVIDPGDNIPEIMDVLNRHALHLIAIVITHGHIDHVAGAKQLKDLTGAPVYMNPKDAELLSALEVQAQWLGVETPDAVDVDTEAQNSTVLKL